MNIALSRYWSLLTDYLRPQGGRVLVLTLLLFSSIGLQLLNPQLVRSFIDTATSGGSESKLFLLAGVFVGVALAGQAMAVGATWLSEIVAWTATNALRADLFDHCLRLDPSFHKSRTPGEMIQRIDGDVDALSLFFSQLAIQVIGNLLLLFGVLVILFLEDWRIGAALGVFAVATLAVLTRLRLLGVPYWAAEREAGAQFYGYTGELLSATEDVRANGARDYALDRFYRANRRWLGARRQATLASTTMWASSLALFALGNIVAFAVGAYLWDRGAVSIGTVYLVFNYTELLRRPIEQIRQQLQELQSATASIGRIEELLRTDSRLEDRGRLQLPQGALELEFDAVSFAYEGDDAVLRDVGFRLAAGRSLGVLGRTGSGKTTLARLIFRLYDPDRGEVRLGGCRLADVGLERLRRGVGLVSQDVQLFDASVRDNLTFFDASVADARLNAALADLGLGDWLASLPEGLDTRISRGALSAGEAQLLAFARVFLAAPGLIVLDEASSRLDPATERLIDRAVDRLLQGRTAVIIAHRLATLDRVDDVLILEDGRVVETGAREALASAPDSRFARLRESELAGALV